MATLANINVALTASTRGFQAGVSRAQRMVGKLRGGLNAAFMGLRGLGGVVAGALSIRSIQRANDEWINMRNQIGAITGKGQEQEDAMGGLFRAAQRSRAPMDALVETFQKFGIANDVLGFSNDELIRMTETAAKLGVVGGTSSEAMSNALRQMGQGLAAGVLRAEEFNSMVENMPMLVQELGKEMGLSMGQFRASVLSGTMTAERLATALLGLSARADQMFGQTDVTVAQKMTQIQNSWRGLIGAISDANVTGNLFGDMLERIRISLDFLTDAINKPQQALEDLRLTWSAFKRDFADLFDFFKTIGNNPLTRVGAFAAEQFMDRNAQANRFVGPENPLFGKNLEEKNSAAIVEQLKELNKNLSNQNLAGSFS